MRKRKIWNKFIALVMSAVLLVPGTVVLAEEGQVTEEATVSRGIVTVDKDGFMISEDGILESYTGQGTELTIPNTVKGIKDYAFLYKENITSVVIPNTVTYIGRNAFEGCSGLEEITISNSVTSIGTKAFLDCASLLRITIPDSVTSIGYEAFKGCGKLEEASILGKVTKLESSLFYGCNSLAKVTIPDSVAQIESSVFCGCSNLTVITIPDSVTEMGYSVFNGCSNLTEVNLPAGLTELNGNLFDGCGSLSRIDIPDTVTIIRERAFGDCVRLTEITIPANVAAIGNGAFEGCANLTNIAVAEGNNKYTSVEGILYNKEKTEILAYPGAKENIIIPNGVTGIGGAFRGCSELKSISIPVTVTVIGESAFQDCSGLKAIEISGNVEEIGSSAFAGCSSLETVSLPDSVSVIGENAFKDCSSLNRIELPICLIKIEGKAFSGCSSLRSIDVPETVDEIGLQAFVGCSSLTQINAAEENASYMSIDGCLYNKKITVLCICPEGKTELNIPDSVTMIGNYALSGCDKLMEIKIPWSVTRIGDSAFSGCNGLTSISLSENVTEIWDFAFLACENLKTINIPSGVEKIPRWTFLNCKSLEWVSIAAEEVTIGDKAFYNCNNLTGVSFQGEIRQIGTEVFTGCSNLTFYGKEGSNVAEHAQWEGAKFSAEEVPWTVPIDIFVCQIRLNPESFTYDGTAKIPKVSIYNGNIMLEENTDYTVAYENNINVGTGRVVITGIGNYTGMVNKEFIITGTQTGGQNTGTSQTTGKKLSICQITITPTTYTYDGTAKTPAVTVKDGTSTLRAGTDYQTEYKDNINPGTAKVILTGKGNYTGTVTKTFTIQNAAQNNSQSGSKNLTCTKTSYKKVYGNKPFSLGITLKDAKGTLTCTSSNKKVAAVDNKGKVTIKGTGIAVITVKVSAVGNYSAESVKIIVEVSPKKQTVKSLKTESGRKLKISWKKDSQATGYQIQYSTDKKFKKSTKTVNISKYKTTSKTISKLKAGKKYYVRVRAYKNAKVNGKTKKLYGAWSSGKRSGSIKK